MGIRRALGAGLLALTLCGSPVLAQVGQNIGQFDKNPMVKSGMISFIEPFELSDGTKGKTYRATDTYFQACQIMLITEGNKITAEVFAMPLVDSEEIMRAERVLLDSFLGQSGMNRKMQDSARMQLLESIEVDQITRKHGSHYVQTTLIPAEVPLLVMAIARDPGKLPFSDPAPRTQAPVDPTVSVL